MSNLRFTNFLIIGIALMFGIICLAMHEQQFAIILFGLAIVQLILIVLNWKIKRGNSNEKGRTVRRFIQSNS